ncbi:MAG: major capsid protein [Dechloromonas sp.]|jgi:hypothetical protein|nr:major capsid protein [Dechloromonas sp.]
MTQMTTSQARVVDPILSTVAQGYQNSELIGNALFPHVPVAARAGKILAFGKESFMAYDTARAPGSAIKRISLGYSSASYALVDHALAASVPVEVMEEAQAVPGVNLASAAVRTVQDALALRLEVAQASLATTAGNYASGNKATLSGTSQWSDYTNNVSDPVNDIEVAKEAIRGKVGKRPNVVVMGAAVLAKLKAHPKILDRIKYTGRDVATVDLLASLFGVQKVLVGDAVSASDAGAFSDVWGKYVVVAYTELGSQAEMGRPSFGYTYQLGGYPMVSPARYDGDTRTWLYDVADAVQPVIAADLAGYLISAAVA